ncbi:MAG: (d)CMP kinase [Thermodesulfovibrionales bacterium]
MKKVIAIDGPSGAGKSTLAKLIARELGFDYLDTGALYRAVALHLTGHGLEENAPDEAIEKLLRKVRVEFRSGRVLVNGTDVSAEIRTPEASHYASVFSARLPVRQYLLGIQREAAAHADLVTEGRDMATVVFPGAFRKIYLDASVEERCRRRETEFMARGVEINMDRLRLEIIERDARDSGRGIAPLKKAGDAFFMDSTGLHIDEVFRQIMEFIRE